MVASSGLAVSAPGRDFKSGLHNVLDIVSYLCAWPALALNKSSAASSHLRTASRSKTWSRNAALHHLQTSHLGLPHGRSRRVALTAAISSLPPGAASHTSTLQTLPCNCPVSLPCTCTLSAAAPAGFKTSTPDADGQHVAAMPSWLSPFFFFPPPSNFLVPRPARSLVAGVGWCSLAVFVFVLAHATTFP
ncbi:hypothetical protein IWZ01DRAFT_146318 [Phyllosticta capitalensis]